MAAATPGGDGPTAISTWKPRRSMARPSRRRNASSSSTSRSEGRARIGGRAPGRSRSPAAWRGPSARAATAAQPAGSGAAAVVRARGVAGQRSAIAPGVRRRRELDERMARRGEVGEGRVIHQVVVGIVAGAAVVDPVGLAAAATCSGLPVRPIIRVEVRGVSDRPRACRARGRSRRRRARRRCRAPPGGRPPGRCAPRRAGRRRGRRCSRSRGASASVKTSASVTRAPAPFTSVKGPPMSPRPPPAAAVGERRPRAPRPANQAEPAARPAATTAPRRAGGDPRSVPCILVAWGLHAPPAVSTRARQSAGRSGTAGIADHERPCPSASPPPSARLGAAAHAHRAALGGGRRPGGGAGGGRLGLGARPPARPRAPSAPRCWSTWSPS